MTSSVLIDSNLSDLQLLSKGKVRDIYATSDSNLLLFVASDRISAYDVILRNVSPLTACRKNPVADQLALSSRDSRMSTVVRWCVPADRRACRTRGRC